MLFRSGPLTWRPICTGPADWRCQSSSPPRQRAPSVCSPCAHTRPCHLLPASLRGAADRPARAVWIAPTPRHSLPRPHPLPWISLSRARQLPSPPLATTAATGPPSLPQLAHQLRHSILTLPAISRDRRSPEAPPRRSSPLRTRRSPSTNSSAPGRPRPRRAFHRHRCEPPHRTPLSLMPILSSNHGLRRARELVAAGHEVAAARGPARRVRARCRPRRVPRNTEHLPTLPPHARLPRLASSTTAPASSSPPAMAPRWHEPKPATPARVTVFLVTPGGRRSPPLPLPCTTTPRPQVAELRPPPRALLRRAQAPPQPPTSSPGCGRRRATPRWSSRDQTPLVAQVRRVAAALLVAAGQNSGGLTWLR